MKTFLEALVILLFVHAKFVSVESTNGTIDISSAGVSASIDPCEEICADIMDMMIMDVNNTMEEDMDNETDAEIENDSSMDMNGCMCSTITIDFSMTSEIGTTFTSPTITGNTIFVSPTIIYGPTSVFVSRSMTATDVSTAAPTSISTSTAISIATTSATIATLTTSGVAVTTTTIATTTTTTTGITTSPTSILNSTSQSTIVIPSTVNTPTTPVMVDTGEAGGGGNIAGIAAGLSLGLGLPIIILTVIAIIICYKLHIAQPGRRKLKRKSESKQLLDEECNINGSAVVDNTVSKTINKPVKETTFNRPTFPPIELTDLPRVVSDLHENNDAGFTQEYRFIQQSSPAFSQTHAYINENMEKNRYRNILPFNDTRVLLKCGTTQTDNYINANYIEGYSGKEAYIATQGPLPNTVADFWQMVWEQKCEIIVMLTGLIEGGKRKCTQYWPEPQDGKLTYGNIEVKIVSQKHNSFYSFTTMEISERHHSTANTTMRSGRRTIQHYAFTEWPDFGVPTSPQTMLRFTRIIRRKILPHRNVPLLVHCSAGVGRTGTFIAIDVMLQRMAKGQTLNIKEFVLGMRYQRNNMVQTERQYVFLYDALLEAYLYGDTAVEAKNVKHHVWSLTQENQAGGTTGMEQEFNRLPSCNYAEESFTVALSTDNLRKNRDKSYIPFDFLRITVGDEESYINAVPVKGYSEETEFLATQHPLVNTISDFWTMVCEQDVKVIVMLGALKNIKDSYLKTTRHSVEITKQEDTQFYTVTHVRIQKPQEHHVVHYMFKGWVPEKIAPTRKSMLALLKGVRSANEPGRPIVVHSSTNMTNEGSGVYCALSICLDSLNNEGYVDVFQTVRLLREQRPYILYSKEFYKFVYLCLVEFLQTHQDS